MLHILPPVPTPMSQEQQDAVRASYTQLLGGPSMSFGGPTPDALLRALALKRPIARLHLSTVEDRRGDPCVRAAYALDWRYSKACNIYFYPEYKLQMLPDCAACGLGTGCYCDACGRALCSRCDDDYGGCCPKCRNSLS